MTLWCSIKIALGLPVVPDDIEQYASARGSDRVGSFPVRGAVAQAAASQPASSSSDGTPSGKFSASDARVRTQRAPDASTRSSMSCFV